MYSFVLLASIFIHSTLVITSPSFSDGEMMPSKYTCNGINVSPELSITEVPKDAITLVLIMFDADAAGGNFDHWVSFDIIPAGRIMENADPGIKGKNSKGTLGYTGPCAPEGIHHYHFRVYALDSQLNLKEGASRKTIEEVMADHILATGEITGLFGRK